MHNQKHSAFKCISYSGKNLIIKDESINPISGTHKDRLAHAVVDFYSSLRQKSASYSSLPQLSLISSGSASIAIGRMLSKYGLPRINVLADHTLAASKGIIANIQSAYCNLYFTDLAHKQLSSKDILTLTDNENGLDLTHLQSITAYDGLCREVLAIKPDFVFVPYGSGKLFSELLTACKYQTPQCSILGATTANPLSKADKLYCPFNPSRALHQAFLQHAKKTAMCGKETGIYSITEKTLHEAYIFAQEHDIACEPSGIRGLALYFQMVDQIPLNSRVVIINTGKLKLL